MENKINSNDDSNYVVEGAKKGCLSVLIVSVMIVVVSAIICVLAYKSLGIWGFLSALFGIPAILITYFAIRLKRLE
jgi:VIT1/CCC1 family predicted Fe2+/Mn2+ transporter